MRCPRCMSPYDYNMRFCPRCGLRVEDLKVEVPEPEPVVPVPGSEELEPEPEESEPEELDSSEIESDELDDDTVSADDADDGFGDELQVEEPTDESETQVREVDVVAAPKDETTHAVEPARTEETGQEEPFQPVRLSDDNRKKGVLRIAFVAGLIAVITIVGVLVYNAEMKRQEDARIAAYEEALRTPQPVLLNIQFTESSNGKMTPIPLRVEGVAKNGDRVDEVKLVSADDESLEVLPGSYKVSLEGFPASDDGTLYEGSVDVFGVVVEERTSAEDKDATSSPLVFVFSPKAPQDIRDTDVATLRKWLEASHVPNASTYVTAVSARREEALSSLDQEQRELEEAELKRVEEETSRLEQELRDSQTQSDTGIVEVS